MDPKLNHLNFNWQVVGKSEGGMSGENEFTIC